MKPQNVCSIHTHQDGVGYNITFVLTHNNELIETDSEIAGCSNYLQHIKELSREKKKFGK